MTHDAAVVVPMYREAPVVAETVRGLLARFDHVVCVDDGSDDDTADVARSAGALVVRHPTNLGQGAALETGIRFALRTLSVDYVVTFDADGQHDPDDAVAMVAHARETGVEVVLGSRLKTTDASVPAARRQLLHLAALFTRHTTGLAVTDAHNGLRVFNRASADALRIRLHGMAHASEILAQVSRHGWTWTEYPVTIAYTDYSMHKGQRGWNALNIVFDLASNRFRPVTS